MVEFKAEYPFASGLSENARLNWNPRMRRAFANSEYVQHKLNLILALRRARCEKMLVFNPKAKVFVNLMVYKPNNRSDSQNFIKPICDAVSAAIGANDNMFEGMWQWSIDKKNPRFVITVTQGEENKNGREGKGR